MKVMKEKDLQPRLLYPARISFRFGKEIKSFTARFLLALQAKAKIIQHHQTNFTTNVKETSVGRKHKRRKRPTKANPKQFRK